MGALLYNNLLRGSNTITSIGTVTGGVGGLTDGRTSTSETFATGANREITIQPFIGGSRVNCLGVGRNNLLDSGATITLLGSNDNSSYTSLFTYTAAASQYNNVVCKVDSTDHQYSYYRIRVSGQSQNVFMSDLAIGEALRLQRDQMSGFVAPEFADGDRVRPNITRGRNLVGLSLDRHPKRVRARFKYYTRDFFDDWEFFVRITKLYPFYFSWPTDDDETPFYCWYRDRVPQPSFSANISGKNYLDFSMDLEGISY